MSQIKLLSVNIAQAQTIAVGAQQVRTGIFKRPVAEPVAVNTLGLANDAVVNTKHHGGPDQAVYLYSAEDYAWWEKERGQEMPFGTFGENLTLSTFGAEQIKIGDRYQIGDVLLEVTASRIPCGVLSARVGDSQFVKQFSKADRPGLYARVLETGTLQVNDTVTYIPTKADHPTVNELYALYYAKDRDPALIRRALAAPIAIRARAMYEKLVD